MRPIYRLNIFQVSILAVLFLRLEADSEDSDCEPELKVARDTVYKAVIGEYLRINCTVAFCNNSPPTVTWYKREKTDVPVEVGSRIKTDWEHVDDSEGILFLIFQKIFRNDSGVYQCAVGGTLSHNINVSVHESPTAQDTFWPYVYGVVGIMAFVIMVVAIYVGSDLCRSAEENPGTQEI